MKRDPIVLGEGLILPAEDLTRPNDNILVVGCSGTGKSLSILLPTLMKSEHTNPILNYAKEFDAYCMARYLTHKGYENDILNLFDIGKSSVAPDPLRSVESFEDIDALSAAIINGTITKTVDDYWQAKARPLLSSLIAATLMTSKPNSDPGMLDVLKLFDELIPRENGYSVETELDSLFVMLEKASPGCYAVREYQAWHSLPYRTASCVRDTLAAALSTVFPESVRNILHTKPNFDIEKFANKKKSLIIITSAIDTAQQFYANLVYRDIERGLLRYAATRPDGQLPRAVRFFYDDMAATAPIQGLPQDLCLFRSAGMSACLLLQSESSLEKMYQEEAAVIRSNVACYCYLPGGMDDRTCEIVSKKIGCLYEDVLYAPMGQIFVMRSGHKPVKVPRFNTLESKEYRNYLEVNGLIRRYRQEVRREGDS